MHADLSALAVVIPFGLGCVVGIAAFSRFLGWLLKRWHDTVVAGLTGLLIGSLWRIWPYQDLTKIEVRGKTKVIEATPFWPEGLDLAVVGLVIAGVVAVLAVEWLARARQPSAA